MHTVRALISLLEREPLASDVLVCSGSPPEHRRYWKNPAGHTVSAESQICQWQLDTTLAKMMIGLSCMQYMKIAGSDRCDADGCAGLLTSGIVPAMRHCLQSILTDDAILIPASATVYVQVM